MYQSDTEMLFPTRVIPSLKNLRGPAWKSLVETAAVASDGDETTLAFGLMMIRLNGCLTCHSDSYRAMRGCTVCAQQSVTRYKDADEAWSSCSKRPAARCTFTCRMARWLRCKKFSAVVERLRKKWVRVIGRGTRPMTRTHFFRIFP